MKKGPVITMLVVLLALAGVVTAFMQSASPYVTIKQAKQMRADRMHLAGDILPGTLRTDTTSGFVSFGVKDASGDTISVEHRGQVPANMTAATKVVAIGTVEGDVFVSQDLLLKCPSRYESEKKGDVAAR